MNEQSFSTQSTRSSKDVLAFYDRYAPTWDARFGDEPSAELFHRGRFKSFEQVADLRAGDKAVELGVGTGHYLPLIAPQVREIICIDGSQAMLDQVQSKHARLPHLTTLRRDLEEPLADVAFNADLVYWFGVLEHILDVDTFLANCVRMLRPGGRIVLVAPNGRSLWYGQLRRLWRAGRHCSSDRYYTLEACDRMFARHGLEREAEVYWGYAPAGISERAFRTLEWAGRIVGRTWLRRYAGGLSARYRLRGGQTPREVSS